MSKFKSFTKEMRKRLGTDVKGFTLIEVIVVLVILAILMAIAIPNVLGYINKAKGTENELNARNVFMAAQVETAEILKENPSVTKDNFGKKHLESVCNLANIKYVDGQITVVNEAEVTPATDNKNNTPKIVIVIKDSAVSGVQYVPAQTQATEEDQAKIVNYHADGSINTGVDFNKKETTSTGGSSESK